MRNDLSLKDSFKLSFQSVDGKLDIWHVGF